MARTNYLRTQNYNMIGGPLPIPTAIKEMEGWPSKEKKCKREPKPTVLASLIAPAWLSDDAKKLWKKLIREYMLLGVYSIDTPVFAAYCDSLADYIRLTGEIKAEGEVINGINKAGNPYVLPNPKCALKHQAWMRMKTNGAEIGHSPASRARLGRLLDDDTDELDDFVAEKPE